MKMPIRVLKGLLCMALCFTTATTFAKSSIECPSQNFKVFIKAFSNNVQIQKRFTAFPISVSAIDPTTVDYSFKTKYITRVDAQFPLFPLYKNRLAQNIQVRKVTGSGLKRPVETQIPDSDSHAVDFTFVKQKHCWYLKAINNASL